MMRGWWQISSQYSKAREPHKHQGYKSGECIVNDPQDLLLSSFLLLGLENGDRRTSDAYACCPLREASARKGNNSSQSWDNRAHRNALA